MAKRKTAPVITLHREELPNGNIKLTSPKGIMDTRSGSVYTRVICRPELEWFFEEVEIDA